MNSPATLRSFEGRLGEAFPLLSEAELQRLGEHFHDVSCEKTNEICTDISSLLGAYIRRALVGRYRIFRRLLDDVEYWDEYSMHYCDYSAHLPHPPDIIAAALAIRPVGRWEWTVVDAWSWVYRHAAILDISVDDFKGWCLDQDPKCSRAFVKADLEQQADPVSPSNIAAANDNV